MTGGLYSARINNKRDLRLFLWYLSAEEVGTLVNTLVSKSSNYNEGDIFGSDVDLASSAINQAIGLIKDNEIKVHYSLRFDFFKSLQLSPGEFTWIKKSSDACYYAWLFIKTQVHALNGSLRLEPNITGKIRNKTYSVGYDDYYSYLQINTYPVDNKERIVAIEDFFDRVPAALRAKLNLMHNIRKRWEELYHLSANFPLSPKEKKKCDWAWAYIQKDKSRMNTRRKNHAGNYTGEVNAASSINSEVLPALRPSTAYEKYMAVKFYYVFSFEKDKLFIQRFKKAWEMHQYRTPSGSRRKKASTQTRNRSDKAILKPVPSIPVTLADISAACSEEELAKRIAEALPDYQGDVNSEVTSHTAKKYQDNHAEDADSAEPDCIDDGLNHLFCVEDIIKNMQAPQSKFEI